MAEVSIRHIAACLAVIAALVGFSVSADAARLTAAPSTITNGSFESGLVGWTADAQSAPCPWTVIDTPATTFVCHAGFGFQEPAADEGARFVSVGFDRPSASAPADATLSHDLKIPPNAASATLHWSDFISWDLATFGAQEPRSVTVEIRNADGTRVLRTISRQTLLPGTTALDTATWTRHSADLSAFAGRRIAIVFHLSTPEVLGGPATYSLDAVSLDVTSRS